MQSMIGIARRDIPPLFSGLQISNIKNMAVQQIHYCFTLSEEQLEYLRNKKYKIDRMECFMSLVKLAERETKLVQVSKTQQVEILRGQLMVDNTQLAKLWDKDRKTVPKIIEAMEALGISSSQKVGENRIHTLHSLSGWYVNGHFVYNDFALKRNADHSAIIHADVPPARVITVEVADDKIQREESSDSGSDKSTNLNEGKNPPANGFTSHPSPQSNDSGNVGKSETDAASSDSAHDNNSPQSAGIPSSSVETDGSLKDNASRTQSQTSLDYAEAQLILSNVGKRKEEASPQNAGGHGQQPDGYQTQPYNGYQKPNGNYNPDGSK